MTCSSIQTEDLCRSVSRRFSAVCVTVRTRLGTSLLEPRHATTTRNNRAQQPHATTTRNDHTQRPHATTTRNNHTHRPHATTARSHRASRRVARIRVERTPWRTIARRQTHRTKPAGVKAARICWAIRRSTATACRGEVGCTSEPSHASRPRERSERVGQEAPCVLHELSGDDPHDR